MLMIVTGIYWWQLQQTFFSQWLPFPLIQMWKYTEEPVVLTPEGDPVLIDFAHTDFTFEEFVKRVGVTDQSAKIDKTKVRQILFEHSYEKVGIYQRYKEGTWGFDIELEHTYQVIAAKTAKDSIVQAGKEEFTLGEVKSLFYDDNKYVMNMNRLLLAMQRYVMHHPMHKDRVENDMFEAAVRGNKEAENYCMVNFKNCRIDINLFWLLKASDRETFRLREDLLRFEDWESYYPLF